MTPKERLRLAKEAMRRKLEQRLHVITWRSTADRRNYSGIQGFEQLAKYLGVSSRSLNCYLSTGKGTYSRSGVNPTTGETDILTVHRIDSPAKPKRPRGRPRKHFPAELA